MCRYKIGREKVKTDNAGFEIFFWLICCLLNFLQEATHGEQFRGDLKRNLERNVGFDAVMRLRCSTGDESWNFLKFSFQFCY